MKTVFLQGLTGVGLVGFQVARTFLTAFQAERIRSYPEFFPKFSSVEDGRLSGQNIEVFRIELNDDRRLYVLNGEQPPENVLSSMFIHRFLEDLSRWHAVTPFDLYMSFGASFSNFTIQVQNVDMKTEEVVSAAIDREISMLRTLFIAASGELSFDEIRALASPDAHSVEKGREGYITGLNGVLPACVGDHCGIPALTVMVQAQIPDFTSSESPLYQLCGLCASRAGVAWLLDLFGLESAAVIQQLDDAIVRLREPASDQLLRMLQAGPQPDANRDRDRESTSRITYV
jgi:hypothetical protein